jgi:hypothetical protein
MVGWPNVLPTLTAFIAFLLGILCLFAGTKKNLLFDANIFTVRQPSALAYLRTN